MALSINIELAFLCSEFHGSCHVPVVGVWLRAGSLVVRVLAADGQGVMSVACLAWVGMRECALLGDCMALCVAVIS